MRKKIVFIFLFFVLFFSSSVLGASSSSLDISSPTCILVEESTDTVIYEKNSDTQMYPASTTKILTALLTLENGNLDDVVTVSHTAVSTVDGGYATPYISEGEQLTVEQLLNVLLVPSGNVAGNILAEYVSGSIDEFVNLMNSRAKELGCTNSHFTNPYGKHDENHYSTAHDLYLMAKEAMKFDVFREIVAKSSYVLEPTNKYSKNDRILTSTNDLIRSSSSSYYEYAIGIKTGYTSQAKDCLVAAATKDGVTYYAVILGADKNSSGVSYRFIDAKKLFEYAFKNYLFRTVKSKGAIVQTVEVQGATMNTKNLNIVMDSTISAFVSTDDIYSSFIPTINIDTLSAPISKGDVVGNISYNINGIVYSSNLLADSDVQKSYLFVFVDIGVVIVFLIIIRLFVISKKSKKRKKYINKKKNYRIN